MTRAELRNSDPALANIVERLVKAYAPERIYLFGSMARGEHGRDSDYDLMVIVPDDAPPERRGSRLGCQALRGTGVAAARELTADPPLLEDIVFHAQQAVEKCFKAFLAWNGVAFRKTHSLEELG
jgi:hypothetical protein